MKTVKIGDIIHIVTYACTKLTLCNKPVELGSSLIEKSSIWEITCPKCKKIVSPYKEFISSR